ncbi:MAG: hypothetical protein IJO75_01300 [Clostridia bacterium]|nr:hypothetical protein [Clostridia bacterium]
MKNYELMTLLSETKANENIKVSVCLTIEELMQGGEIDKGLYHLTLDICDFDDGVISTEV